MTTTTQASLTTTAAIKVVWSKKAATTRRRRRWSQKRKRGASNNSSSRDDGNNKRQQQQQRATTTNGATKSDDDDESLKNYYYLMVLRKRGKEHLAALQMLAKAWRCPPSAIGVAGMKDMRAVTYQFCTVTGVRRNTLLRSSSSSVMMMMTNNNTNNNTTDEDEPAVQVLGMPIAVPKRLERGDLQGNRFQITIRNLGRIAVNTRLRRRDDNDSSNNSSSSSSSNHTVDEQVVPLEALHLAQMVQRVQTHGFCNFFGEQRVGLPADASIAGVRPFDIGRAMLQQNFAKAIDLLMTGRGIIHGNETESAEILTFRQVWKQSGGDPVQSWKALPRSSGGVLTRERAVLQGLKRYGKDKPLQALRCLPRQERTFYTSAYQSFVWNCMASQRIKRLGTVVVIGDLVQDENGTVKHVYDENELSTGTWTLDDVVLPLPGYGVLFPNHVIGDLYKQMLEKDDIHYTKDAPEEATARGNYRKLVARASNLHCEPKPETVESATIRFDLPKGSYATVLLRELMVTTVDREV